MSVYDTEPWVIWSFEHNCWWNNNSQGYTWHLKNAGHYSKDEACKIVIGAGADNEIALPLSVAQLWRTEPTHKNDTYFDESEYDDSDDDIEPFI